MHPITKRKLEYQNESSIVKTKAEQSFCYAPKEEGGCICSKWFSGGILPRGWRRRNITGIIHFSRCICRFELEFCKNKKERAETLYQSFSPFMAEAVGFEPTDPSLDHSISSRGRYDHFDTLPLFMPLIEIAYSYIIWIVSRMSIGKSKNLDLFFDFLDCGGGGGGEIPNIWIARANYPSIWIEIWKARAKWRPRPVRRTFPLAQQWGG